MFFRLFVNLMVITIWSLFVCFLCKNIDGKHFDENNTRYKPRKWEDGGRWYSKNLKINKWKDIIPQYISKGGFSKEHFGSSNLDVKYINRFILETCRAEWVHSLYFLIAVPLIIFNSPLMGAILGSAIILFNVQVVAVQRYNRFRLQRIRKKLLKENINQDLNGTEGVPE